MIVFLTIAITSMMRLFYSTRPAKSKIYPSAEAALKAAKIASKQTLLVGGFGLCGVPMESIFAIKKLGGTFNYTINLAFLFSI